MIGRVYHGSSNGDIKELLPSISTHNIKCIYASENKAVAMIFMSNGNRDLDRDISYKNGVLSLVERRPGVFDKLYNKPGYLYELDGSTFEHYSYLWGPEVISLSESIKPLSVTYYENIMDGLIDEQEKGNMIIYRYPNRPDNIPLDNSDLIDKYINSDTKIKSLLDIYPEFTEAVNERLKHK